MYVYFSKFYRICIFVYWKHIVYFRIFSYICIIILKDLANFLRKKEYPRNKIFKKTENLQILFILKPIQILVN